MRPGRVRAVTARAATASNLQRVFERVYVLPAELPGYLAAAQEFYGVRPSIYFSMPEREMHVIGLESETVSFSVVSAPAAALDPLRDTAQTILVADIDAALAAVEAAGGRIRQPKTPVPPGFQARGQLPGGPVIEFAQWDHAEEYRDPDLRALGLAR